MLARATSGQLDALVVAGGSATLADLVAARAAAAQLPLAVAGFLLRKGARVVVCRGSITDHETALKGVRPRGWPEGQTWDIVPGVYLPGRKQVVIATVDGPGGRTIAPRGTGHGSVDLLLHEAMHGHDFLKGHRLLKQRAFRDARTADLAVLGDYERQSGDAGLQETYAESAARAFATGPALLPPWPTLAGYWQALEETELETAAAIATEQPEVLELADAPIGTATYEAGGALLLDLRAEGPDGAIGHALVRLSPGDPAYGAIVRPGELEGASPAAQSGRFLVMPFP
jgi:hypothetical protein